MTDPGRIWFDPGWWQHVETVAATIHEPEAVEELRLLDAHGRPVRVRRPFAPIGFDLSARRSA